MGLNLCLLLIVNIIISKVKTCLREMVFRIASLKNQVHVYLRCQQAAASMFKLRAPQVQCLGDVFGSLEAQTECRRPDLNY